MNSEETLGSGFEEFMNTFLFQQMARLMHTDWELIAELYEFQTLASPVQAREFLHQHPRLMEDEMLRILQSLVDHAPDGGPERREYKKVIRQLQRCRQEGIDQVF